MNDFDINTRDGLPAHLRLLADRYPRDGWESHDNFSELTRFWLDRHLMFRKALGMMQDETQGFLNKEIDDQRLAHQTARIGGFFVQNLHGHHMMEDQHYFPLLIGKEPKLGKGFEILDADHHALDAHLKRFTDDANALIQAVQAGDGAQLSADALRKTLEAMEKFLNRHLTDEEELIVPILLEYGDPET